MKKIITFIFILSFSMTFSQEIINYEKIKREIENSAESLSIIFSLPKKDFYVFTVKDIIVENLDFDPCKEIYANKEKNKKVIEILNDFNLLSDFYFEMENETYLNIKTNKTFEWKNAGLILTLYYSSNDSDGQVYIPIFNRKMAKQFVEKISKIFDSEYCFNKLKRKI